MVCPRGISVDTLHKGDTEDNNINNNKLIYLAFLLLGHGVNKQVLN
jgi:hypothetical protein